MNLAIDNKFNVGEEVWVISVQGYNGKYTVSSKLKIEGIRIDLYGSEISVDYIFDYYDIWEEQHCFRTKEEAQSYCDEKNSR